MLVTLKYSEIESSIDRYIPIDVRSPLEYAESTITGAVNIPLFSNEERAEVGTLYKQAGKAYAVRKGIEFVSRSLPNMYDRFEKLLHKQKKLLIFCARGGMRSESVAGLFSSLGFPVIKLYKGYKGYRQHVMEQLPQLIASKTFITLYGKTGTGKTEILKHLSNMGKDILDLEGCAGHRGSVFGLVGLNAQPSQKQFETRIYDSLKRAESDIIFTEGESKRIGSVSISNELYFKINHGHKILIEADIPTRKKIIAKEYIGENFDKRGAVNALNFLVRYIGKEKIKEYAAMIENNLYDRIIEELMIKYYDVVYNNLKEGYEQTFINKDCHKTAEDIVKWSENTASDVSA